MEFEDVVDSKTHVFCDLLPSQVAEITLLKEGLKVGVFNLLDYTHDFPLQIYEPVDVRIYLVFKVDNLAYDVLHIGLVRAGVLRHIR